MKKIAIVLIIVALVAAFAYAWRAAPRPADRLFFGFIRSAEGRDGAAALSIDEAELLSGKEAEIKGAEDTGCPIARVSDCIPSLNNDFYIRNLSTGVREYRLSAHADISIMQNPGSPVLSSTTMSGFLALYPDPAMRLGTQPFHFWLKGGEIVKLEEQYTP